MTVLHAQYYYVFDCLLSMHPRIYVCICMYIYMCVCNVRVMRAFPCSARMNAPRTWLYTAVVSSVRRPRNVHWFGRIPMSPGERSLLGSKDIRPKLTAPFVNSNTVLSSRTRHWHTICSEMANHNFDNWSLSKWFLSNKKREREFIFN